MLYKSNLARKPFLFVIIQKPVKVSPYPLGTPAARFDTEQQPSLVGILFEKVGQMYEEPIYDDSSEENNIETIYDQQQLITKLRAANARLHAVLDAANKLTDIEFSVVETAIEAVYFPGADRERQRTVGALLDKLFAAVKEYRRVEGIK